MIVVLVGVAMPVFFARPEAEIAICTVPGLLRTASIRVAVAASVAAVRTPLEEVVALDYSFFAVPVPVSVAPAAPVAAVAVSKINCRVGIRGLVAGQVGFEATQRHCCYY